MKDYKRKKKKINQAGLENLGCICKDINLYELIDKTSIGKSSIGAEMDTAGRWLFNHRLGGGHLWWKELTNRPYREWKDVLSHLASDFFTSQGLPYAVGATVIRNNTELIKEFGKVAKSSENWAMLNGFEFISGNSSLVFSIYEAKELKRGYSSDLALGADSVFIALNIFGGFATANPLLVVSGFIKSTTLFRKMLRGPNTPSYGPFDIEIDHLLDVQTHHMDIDSLLKVVDNFDFKYDSKKVTF